MKDLEELVPAPQAGGQGGLRSYVLQLVAGLERRRADGGKALTHDDFHRVTSELNKAKQHAVYAKPQLIHEYRRAVGDSAITYDQQVEALLIKKLGRSGFGGVNLSLFIPPGHSAPVWNVTATRTAVDRLTVDVVEQKSTYTLLGYRNYTRHREGRPVLVAPGLRAVTLEARIERGDEVNDADHAWLAVYREQPEYQTQALMCADFGFEKIMGQPRPA